MKAPGTRSVLAASLRTAGAESWPSSRLPRFPVLAFLVWNVFVATFVPKMAAGCSPEVTLVSVDWATSPRSGQRGGGGKKTKQKTETYILSKLNRCLRSPPKSKVRCALPSSCPCLLCDRDAGLKWNRKHPLGATVRVTHN